MSDTSPNHYVAKAVGTQPQVTDEMVTQAMAAYLAEWQQIQSGVPEWMVHRACLRAALEAVLR